MISTQNHISKGYLGQLLTFYFILLLVNNGLKLKNDSIPLHSLSLNCSQIFVEKIKQK